jgi:hypothetical protein
VLGGRQGILEELSFSSGTLVCIGKYLFYMEQKPLVGEGLLIIEASRSHSDTQHSVGLLWMGDQPNAETSTGQHT